MDAGGTATTECPPNKGSEWKHESPDFSRGESQQGRRKFRERLGGCVMHVLEARGHLVLKRVYVRRQDEAVPEGPGNRSAARFEYSVALPATNLIQEKMGVLKTRPWRI